MASTHEGAADAAGVTCFHNTDPLVINRDPLATMAINDAHRRPDVKDGAGSDLWSLNQWADTFPHEQLDDQYPVMSPVEILVDGSAWLEWCPASRITQPEYKARFTSKFKIVSDILPIEHVVVAGGAAAYPIGNLESETGDVDLFIYGIDPTDDSALWEKVSEISERLKGSTQNADEDSLATQTIINTGVITFRISTMESFDCKLVVQVILRAYPSISAILHGFDIPSCCVAFDGRTTYLTGLSAWAHAFRINMVNPAYRSTTLEPRLVKYYRRGYAIMMLQLNKKLFTLNKITILAHVAIYPITKNGAYFGGLIRAKSKANYYSDYTDINTTRDHASDVVNSKAYLLGTSQFSMKSTYFHWDVREPWSKFHMFKDSGRAIQDILSRKLLLSYLDSQSERVVLIDGGVDLKILIDIFGLDLKECQKLHDAVCRAGVTYACRPLDVKSALIKFYDRILDRFDHEPRTPIKWWITVDPTRQYTCSLNPRLEHPSEWYGPDAYVSETTQIADAHAPGGGICAICMTAVGRGGNNTVVLSCGHNFHYSALVGGVCGGLYRWSTIKNSCPMCRTPFDVDTPTQCLDKPEAYYRLQSTLDSHSKVAVEVEW